MRKITFFGLKLGQDMENRAAHPHKEFPGVPLPPPTPGTRQQGNNDPSDVHFQFLMDTNVMYISFISGVSAFRRLCEELPWPFISNTGE